MTQKIKKQNCSLLHPALFLVNFLPLIVLSSSFLRSLTFLISGNIDPFWKAESNYLLSHFLLNNMKIKEVGITMLYFMYRSCTPFCPSNISLVLNDLETTKSLLFSIGSIIMYDRMLKMRVVHVQNMLIKLKLRNIYKYTRIIFIHYICCT